MTSEDGTQRSSFICVDSTPETYGSAVFQNGALLYLTQTLSGTNAPMGFSDLYEVTCSHCTVADAANGSVFVEWGTSSCPESALTVYSGQSAGAFFETSGGYEYLCLPMYPEYSLYNSFRSSLSYIYAADYSTSAGGVLALKALNGAQVPCSVCQRPSRLSASLMVPGATTCPQGFSVDYLGFVVSPADNQNKGQYICLNQQATSIGSASNSIGSLMNAVEADNPVPLGYTPSWELSCVVCSGERIYMKP